MAGFEGAVRLKATLENMKRNSQNFIVDELLSAANTVRNEAIKSIQAKPAGKPYTRYSPRREGVASAQGDAPHTDTGNLVNHVLVEQVDDKTVEVGSIGEGAGYGKHLEYNEHPWLRPAYLKSKSVITEKLRRAGIAWVAEFAKR